MHHGCEEERVLDQLGQALATLIKLSLHHILISGQIVYQITDRSYTAWSGTDIKQQMVSILTWPMSLINDFIKDSLWKNQDGSFVRFFFKASNISSSDIVVCSLSSYTVPLEKRFWKQSACSPGRELFQHFPSSQLSLSADPRNLRRTGESTFIYV